MEIIAPSDELLSSYFGIDSLRSHLESCCVDFQRVLSSTLTVLSPPMMPAPSAAGTTTAGAGAAAGVPGGPPGSNNIDSLLRFFQSDYFRSEIFYLMHYLYHDERSGVQDYLVNLLYDKPDLHGPGGVFVHRLGLGLHGTEDDTRTSRPVEAEAHMR